MVTTATGACATSMPKRIALAGPRPYVLSTVRTRGSRAATECARAPWCPPACRSTTRTSAGIATARRIRSRQGTIASPSLYTGMTTENCGVRRHTRTPLLVHAPHVRDGNVGLQVTVLGVGRGDDQQVGLAQDLVQRDEPVVLDVRVGAEGLLGLERDDLAQLVGQDSRMSSLPPLNAMPRMPTVISDRSKRSCSLDTT